MIRKSFIAPTALIPEFGNQGDFHLALSHLLPHPSEGILTAYEQNLKESKKPIILDNGLFENGVPEDMDSLVEKAKHIGAEIVFTPDVLFNRAETEANIGPMIERLAGTGIKLGAVVQADNWRDYIESYQWMVNHPAISLIGLSILSIPKCFKRFTDTDDITANRLECLERLNKLISGQKESHLLGAGSSYKDVEYANFHCPWVVSHDSSSAVWNGLQGKEIDEFSLEVAGGKSHIPVDFDFEEELSVRQRFMIQHNIKVINQICK